MTNAPTIMKDHRAHKSGESKTVCVTACLTALGIDINGFNYTGSASDGRRQTILRRNGYAVRSRKSRLPKTATIGTTRKAIRKMNDPTGTKYLVIVWGKGYCHAMLLDEHGATLVDTAPRDRDRRKVHSIHAVWPKSRIHRLWNSL